jgi:hypothetical protein
MESNNMEQLCTSNLPSLLEVVGHELPYPSYGKGAAIDEVDQCGFLTYSSIDIDVIWSVDNQLQCTSTMNVM